jgi:signal transduction histidine kinase
VEVIGDREMPARTKNSQLAHDFPGKKPRVIISDGPIIKEVLTNIVSNAIKYSNEDSTVKVGIDIGEKYATVSVEDTGMGIPKKAQDQIFSKFFRAHNVIQIETNGTGIGLYLVKGLVNELGGTINFSSTENVGTVFTVRLPIKKGSE